MKGAVGKERRKEPLFIFLFLHPAAAATSNSNASLSSVICLYSAAFPPPPLFI